MYVRAYYLSIYMMLMRQVMIRDVSCENRPAHLSEGRVTFSTTFQNGFLDYMSSVFVFCLVESSIICKSDRQNHGTVIIYDHF